MKICGHIEDKKEIESMSNEDKEINEIYNRNKHSATLKDENYYISEDDEKLLKQFIRIMIANRKKIIFYIFLQILI